MTGDRYTLPFWEALDEGRLLIHACEPCGERFFPPAPVCPACGSRSVGWEESDGRGRLHAVTRQHVTPPGFPSPTDLGVVELSEGCRLLAAVEGADPAVGDAVEVRPAPYDHDYDRGDLADYPFLAAAPLGDGAADTG